MKILFITLVLDGMPFLPLIFAELRKLPKEIQWEWEIMEGVALPEHCTRWVSSSTPRLSKDGTSEYIYSLAMLDHRVTVNRKPAWKGKIEMVNRPFDLTVPHHPSSIVRGKDEFLLWQIDSDEIWTAEQIHKMWQMFTWPRFKEKNAAFFWCRYFVGPDKVITTRNCFGNYSNHEWHRVWKIKPGMVFKTHEPPVIEGLKLNPFTHAETELRGLVFDHMSWCTRAQVEMKANYYAGPNNPNARHYKGLVERWEKFQNQTTWPRPLREIFPWAEPHVMVKKV